MRVCSPSVRSIIFDKPVILLYSTVVYLFGWCPLFRSAVKNLSSGCSFIFKAGDVYQNRLVVFSPGVFHEIVSACVLVCICLWGLMSFTPLARRRPRGNSGLAVWLTAFPGLQLPAVLHTHRYLLMLLISFTTCCFTVLYSQGFTTNTGLLVLPNICSVSGLDSLRYALFLF